MAKKDFLSIYDLSAKEIKTLFNRAFELKKKKKILDVFKGKTLGIMMDKTSSAITASFAAAIVQLGGTPVHVDITETQLHSNSRFIHDTAAALSCYLDGLAIGTLKHSDTSEFAKYSTVPVINGFSNVEDPCQILADIMTMMESYKITTTEALKKIKIVYIGSGSNISNSLLAAASILGLDLTLIAPKGYPAGKEMLNKSLEYIPKSKAEIKITDDINAVENAEVIYTNIWAAALECEDKKRNKLFMQYQVNSELLKKASSKCIVLHCLPVITGEEITEDVMTKHENFIFAQSENRLYVQKALLLQLLK
ncbi:MAG: hypothetical protein LBL71_02855 [Endomicrobium sp.]|jgi:ornithine carbamoyltransferase|nr:hypothetical protein [Endomicrobium sp.]